MMKKGRIKKLLEDKGIGFIKPDGGGDDLFFHNSSVQGSKFPVSEGAPVEFEEGIGRKGPAATIVIVTGAGSGGGFGGSSKGVEPLPDECKFDTFFDENGKLKMEVSFNAPETFAKLLKHPEIKVNQLRMLFKGYQSFFLKLRDGKIDFGDARVEFGSYYTERVVRQVKRGHVPQVIQELFDAHKDIVLKEEREMQAFFQYLKNILCYFGDKDK